MARTARRTTGPAGEGANTAELEAAVGFWLRLAQQKDMRGFNRVFAGSGVTPPLYAMLLVISANPGLRQTQIGEMLRIRQPNLVEPIDTLIGRGLISRRPDPHDRRAQAIDLTPEGALLLGRLRAGHDRLIESYRQRFGPGRYAKLVGLLRAFVALDADPETL